MKLAHGLRVCAVVSLVGAAVLVVVLRARLRPSTSVDATCDATSMTEMREELASLRQRVQASERLAGAAALTVASASRGADPRASEGAGGPIGDTDATRRHVASANITQSDLISRLDLNLQHEQPDPSWTKQAAGSARDQFARLLPPGATLRSLACGATTCKGTVSFPDRSVYENASIAVRTKFEATESFGGVAWSDPRLLPDNGIEVDEYLFRQGREPLREAYEQEEADKTATTE